MRKISISIVTPVYAGRDYLRELVTEVIKVKDTLAEKQAPFEILEMVFVDDASKDGSAQVLAELQSEHSWIRVIELAHNFGQHPATIAGILHTSGDWVATLDEDLQHHPEYLPRLLAEAALNGCDISYARPEEAVHDSIFRDWSSRFYKKLLVKITGIPFIKDFNSFRMIRGSVARATASVCSHETYFDVALCWFSDRIRSITLPLKDRRFIATKKSGYNLIKLFSHARRLIISAQTKMLRIGFFIGALAIPLSLASVALVIYNKFFDPTAQDVPGWASVFVEIAFFCGLAVLMIGVMMEYIRTMLLHIQGKPTFFVIDRSSDKALVDYFRRTS